MLSTPPFAPKIVDALRELGMDNRDALCEWNPSHAFLLLQQKMQGITQSVFWHLVGVVEQCAAHELTAEQRAFWQHHLQQHPPVALFPMLPEMRFFMQQALVQAQQAAALGEVPVGALVVRHGEIIAAAHNQCEQQHNVAAHAEINVLAQAGRVLQNHRLTDCDLYITLEPCAMCASAILQARIRRVIFAAHEPKMGAAGSVVNLFAIKPLNAHTAVKSGILADESRQLLQQFFHAKRHNQRVRKD